MTNVELLFALKYICERAVKGLKLPTAVQRDDKKIIEREPEVHIMRLPRSTDAKKIAPYIIVQFVTGAQKRVSPPNPQRTAIVRFICCVYDSDEETGAISLLNVMEAVQREILRAIKIGKCNTLDPDEPFEMLVYPDDTAPYYMGEMAATFHLPPINQEVDFFEEN